MKTIKVKLGNRSYPIWVSNGLLENISEIMDGFQRKQCAIITQRSLLELYAHNLKKNLSTIGIDVDIKVIPEGEQAKSLSHVQSIYRYLLERNYDRSVLLIALGGGVVGDVTGFVAATYLRGVDYLQIPTTLLAMVDSAIGGKTGVNLLQGKNLVGAFYQPIGVVVDPDLLHSLPHREVVSALGEILKYGAIRDREFFMRLKHNLDSILTMENKSILTYAITRCCEIKASVVSLDEKEQNIRRILNFGHTIGHALETVTDYRTLKHGEAIAYGMIAAGQISHTLGYLSREEQNILELTIRKLPLPRLPDFDLDLLVRTIGHDKKVKTGKLHFVILKGLGNAIITDEVSDGLILHMIKEGIFQF